MDASYTSKAMLFSAVQRDVVYQVNAVLGLPNVISHGCQGAWHLENSCWLMLLQESSALPFSKRKWHFGSVWCFLDACKECEKTDMELPWICQCLSACSQKDRYTGQSRRWLYWTTLLKADSWETKKALLWQSLSFNFNRHTENARWWTAGLLLYECYF